MTPLLAGEAGSVLGNTPVKLFVGFAIGAAQRAVALLKKQGAPEP